MSYLKYKYRIARFNWLEMKFQLIHHRTDVAAAIFTANTMELMFLATNKPTRAALN